MLFPQLRRPVTPAYEDLRIEHAADCAAIHAQFFAHSWSVNDFESMIASAAIFGVAAVKPAKPGFAGFILVRRAADEAEILTLAVAKAHHKQGIGKQLLAHQSEILRRYGVRRLFLEVDEGNSAARRLYDQSGFTQAGTRPAYYRNAKGQTSNALILVCDLN